ncbi:SpoIIE family protein phosphatase [Crossiella sp. NPDC003009]
MIKTAEQPTQCFRVDHASAVHGIAKAARAAAVAAGLPGAMPEQAAVIASELGSNLDKHARDGVMAVQPLLLGHGIEILAADAGPGMADLARCLVDGHSTTGTLGAGLGAIRRMATELHLHSEPGTGTVAAARLVHPAGTSLPHKDFGYVRVPADGERACGDGLALHRTGEGWTALLVDGLGHGPAAAEAAEEAVLTFRRDPELPPVRLLTALHHRLRLTRGAAAAVLRVAGARAEFCGVGNIRGLVLGDGPRRSLLSRPGVVGLHLITPQVTAVDLSLGGTVVLHSDGLDATAALLDTVGPVRLPPALLATGLAHRHRQLRDDATVLIARAREGAG